MLAAHSTFCGDLPALPDAAGAAERRLQDARAAGAQDGCELGLGGEAFAGGDGNARRGLDGGEVEEVVGWNRLLEPERPVGFDRLGKPHGTADRELAMRA